VYAYLKHKKHMCVPYLISSLKWSSLQPSCFILWKPHVQICALRSVILKSFSGFPQFTQVKPDVVLSFRFLSHLFFFQSIIYQHQAVRTVQLSILDPEDGNVKRLCKVSNYFPVDIA